MERRKLTRDLLAKHATTPEQTENVDMLTTQIALRMRSYAAATTGLKLRGHGSKAVRQSFRAPGSSVSVLKRMRRAVAEEKSKLFHRARAELSARAEWNLKGLAHPDHNMRFFDPWRMFFMIPPKFPEMFGKQLPTKANCLRVLDMAIAREAHPGRRVDRDLNDLATYIIIGWTNLSGNELIEPPHEIGSSERTGEMVEFIHNLRKIWRVSLVSVDAVEKGFLGGSLSNIDSK
jgi:hypothetical protein